MAPITRGANRKQAVAPPARPLAKRRVHSVGAAGFVRLDTAIKPWHKRQDWLGSSEHRGGHEGLEGSAPGPHPQSAQPTRSAGPKTSAEAVDGAAPVDAQTAPTSRLGKPQNRFSTPPHRPFLFID